MSRANRLLPEFGDPPLIEALLGVQFGPLRSFSIPHFGLYWAKIRDHYRKCEVQPRLGQAIEEFGARASKGPTIEVMAEPDVRCWFIDQTSTQLIQVQKDRFIRNWRKVKGDDVYPRYSQLKPGFQEEWQRFCEFLKEEGLGTPDVNQCEVTYVNHIEIDRGLRSYGEIHKVVARWSGAPSGDFLHEPELVNLRASYLMPDKKGRLHITLQPAIRRQDPKEILQLTLTARGRPTSSRIQDILDWLDMGHEWIVRGFVDFTTRDMHKIWGRK